jgi:hypothetical protein
MNNQEGADRSRPVLFLYGMKWPAAISSELSGAHRFAAGKKRGFCQRGDVTAAISSELAEAHVLAAGKKRGFCRRG